MEVWCDNCVLLRYQFVNGDSAHYFRGGEHVPVREATLQALLIHCVLKMYKRKKERTKVRNYKKEIRTSRKAKRRRVRTVKKQSYRV
jgi:hypothetical protein